MGPLLIHVIAKVDDLTGFKFPFESWAGDILWNDSFILQALFSGRLIVVA